MDLQAALPGGVVDAVVRVAPIATELAAGRRLTDWLVATPEEVMIEQSGIRILVRGAAEVLIDLDDDADTALVGPLLYGFVVRALLLHAGIFSLHATVVRQHATVVALAGHSGTGKSTTATMLCRFHGAELLVDDLTPVRMSEGCPQVRVFDRPVHLTPEAVERLGLDQAQVTVVAPGPRGKLAVPSRHFGSPVETPGWVGLDHLVALSLARDEREVAAAGPRVVERPLAGGERLRWIVRLSNVTGLATLGDRASAYFEWATALADALPMTNIVRHEGGDTLGEVCTAVLAEG